MDLKDLVDIYLVPFCENSSSLPLCLRDILVAWPPGAPKYPIGSRPTLVLLFYPPEWNLLIDSHLLIIFLFKMYSLTKSRPHLLFPS